MTSTLIFQFIKKKNSESFSSAVDCQAVFITSIIHGVLHY